MVSALHRYPLGCQFESRCGRVFEGSCRSRHDWVKVWVRPCCRPGGMTPHVCRMHLRSFAGKHTHTQWGSAQVSAWAEVSYDASELERRECASAAHFWMSALPRCFAWPLSYFRQHPPNLLFGYSFLSTFVTLRSSITHPPAAGAGLEVVGAPALSTCRHVCRVTPRGQGLLQQ